MAIRFMLGRAGSGKSEACLNELRAKLLEEPDGPPLILLVPEQATFQAEHALVSTPGINGLIRAQVLSFRRLALRVLQETGGITGVAIDDLGKKMLLQRLLHDRQNDLNLYRAAAGQMGFVERLHALFREWTRYLVTPDLLDSHASKWSQDPLLQRKMNELSLLYRDYERASVQGDFLDGDRVLDRLAERIGRSDTLRKAEIWIDGFNGFTPQELEVVLRCMEFAHSVTITLTLNRPYAAGERPHELELFHPTAATMVAIQNGIRDRGLQEPEMMVRKDQVPPRFSGSPMLAHLEHFFEHRLSPLAKPYEEPSENAALPEASRFSLHSPGIVVRSAVHRRAEVEAAARQMIALVRDEGLHWRDIAVRVRNLEDYGELLITVLGDYGIPYFMDQKRSVLHHPLVELIRSALEAAIKGWSYDAVFRCVKTDFFLSPEDVPESLRVDRRGLDELENYVLAYGIQGYRWFDPRSWQLGQYVEEAESIEGDTASEGAVEEELALRPERWHYDRIQACAAQILEPLRRLQQRLEQACSVREMAEAVYLLLEELGVPAQLERWSEDSIRKGKPEKAREHAQIWEMIIEVLDQLTELMGSEELAPDRFAKLVETGLESLRLGLVPPALDQITVGSMDRTRSAQVKVSFVLGAGDGVLPKKQAEDGLLGEPERDLLLRIGVPMADSDRRKLLDEQFLIYTVLCTPSDRLYLSYPLADEEGRSLLPSEIIKQLRSLFPKLAVTMAEAEPSASMKEEEHLSFVSVPGRVLPLLAVQLKQGLRGMKIQPVWWQVYNWLAEQPDWQERLQHISDALAYTNRAAPMEQSTSLGLYGEVLRSSVSRMETFVACPFSHFASYGLKLRERRVYRLEAPDIGQLYHAALSGLAKELMQDPAGWGGMQEEQLLERTALIVERLAPRLQHDILASSARYRSMSRKLRDIVGQAAVMLAEHARRSRFEPVGLEIAFGPDGVLPSLPLRLHSGGRMDVVGRIDRVDRAQSEQGMLLRIIDYKSSPTTLRLPELYYGLSLQMLTYLDVVLTHAEEWLGEPARPAGVLYFHVHHPILSSKNGMSPEEAQKARKKRFKMKGLVSADPEAVYFMDRSMEGAAGHSELIPVAMKADGSFYKSASVAAEPQWDQMRAHVRRTIRSIGSRIMQGETAVEPYRMGSKSACTFCSYKPVCKFDPQQEGNAARYLKPCSKDDVWLALATEEEEEEENKGQEKGGKPG